MNLDADNAVGRSSKFMPRHTGPYIVVHRLSDVNYRVRPIVPPADRRTPAEDTVYVAQMKPCFFRFQPVKTITGIFTSSSTLSHERANVARRFSMGGSRVRRGPIIVRRLGPPRD